MPKPDCLRIRPATATEQSLLRRIIITAHLDPSSLHWQNFVIAESDGQVAGIAQIKPYQDCREFGSLVVLPKFRKRGIAAQLIEQCLAKEHGSIYLLCAHPMERFYEKWGFRKIPFAEAPRTLRFKLVGSMMLRLFGIRIICMRRDI